MAHRILSTLVPLTLGLATVLGATDASADEERVHVYGNLPYGVQGDYVQTGETYNDAPVYALETNAMWSLYRRLNGFWYIDFDDLDEQWSGTVAIGPNAETPFGGSWEVDTWGAIPTDQVTLSNAAYIGGATLTFSGQIYNDAPVYAWDDGAYINSLYRRANGRWYLDFNEVSEDYDGTVEVSNVADWPWEADFGDSMSVAAVTRVDVAECGYFSELNTGEYAFTGEMYNNAPVFQFESGEYTVSVYQREDYRWYLDYNDISEDWDGTIDHALDPSWWPWEATFYNGCEMDESEG